MLRILQIAIPFVWFGMIGAISFMEAPLKFRAPGITLALGLGIGRLVFQALNIVEIVLAILLLISIFVHRPTGKIIIPAFGLILTILALETVWLLPALDARAELVIQGSAVPPSYLHFLYIAFDALKFLLLFALGIGLAKQNLRFEQTNEGY